MPEAMYDKYARRMTAAGLDHRTFAETYSQAILIAPTRYLPWHGRTVSDVPLDAVSTGLIARLRGAIAGLRGQRFGWLSPAPRTAGAPAG